MLGTSHRASRSARRYWFMHSRSSETDRAPCLLMADVMVVTDGVVDGPRAAIGHSKPLGRLPCVALCEFHSAWEAATTLQQGQRFDGFRVLVCWVAWLCSASSRPGLWLLATLVRTLVLVRKCCERDELPQDPRAVAPLGPPGGASARGCRAGPGRCPGRPQAPAWPRGRGEVSTRVSRGFCGFCGACRPFSFLLALNDAQLGRLDSELFCSVASLRGGNGGGVPTRSCRPAAGAPSLCLCPAALRPARRAAAGGGRAADGLLDCLARPRRLRRPQPAAWRGRGQRVGNLLAIRSHTAPRPAVSTDVLAICRVARVDRKRWRRRAAAPPSAAHLRGFARARPRGGRARLSSCRLQ